MFGRNNYKTQTQTQTQTQTLNQTQNQSNTKIFGGSSNTIASTLNTQRNSNPFLETITNNNDEIIYGIVTGNLTTVRRLVNSTNVNKIIDQKNNFTPLHHAVRIKKNDAIIEYLLSIGANPTIKQDEGKDSVDLSIEANYRFLIDKLLKEKDNELDNVYTKIDDINYKLKNLERNNLDLKNENEFLNKSTNEYIAKIDVLKTENTVLKRKYDDSEKAFSNLLKKTKK